METGKYDCNNKPIIVGQTVHFRCKNFALCGKGIVYLDKNNSDGLSEEPFRIKDTRVGRNNGRIYPYYDDAKYRICETD